MLRHELQTSILRFYTTESDDPFAQYDAVCTIIWESPDVVWIRGMHGTISRKTICELVCFLADNNVKLAKAHRSAGRTLPFVTARDDHTIEMDVNAAIKKIVRMNRGSTKGSTI